MKQCSLKIDYINDIVYNIYKKYFKIGGKFMTNRDFVLEQISKTKTLGHKKKEVSIYTKSEIKKIKKSLETWDKADEKYSHKESSIFLLETIKEHISESSKKRNPFRSDIPNRLKEVEIVESCHLENGSKSSRIVIYKTKMNTLEDAVDDYIDNFEEKRVVEIEENFNGICIKSEVTVATWC